MNEYKYNDINDDDYFNRKIKRPKDDEQTIFSPNISFRRSNNEKNNSNTFNDSKFNENNNNESKIDFIGNINFSETKEESKNLEEPNKYKEEEHKSNLRDDFKYLPKESPREIEESKSAYKEEPKIIEESKTSSYKEESKISSYKEEIKIPPKEEESKTSLYEEESKSSSKNENKTIIHNLSTTEERFGIYITEKCSLIYKNYKNGDDIYDLIISCFTSLNVF